MCVLYLLTFPSIGAVSDDGACGFCFYYNFPVVFMALFNGRQTLEVFDEFWIHVLALVCMWAPSLELDRGTRVFFEMF